MARLLLSPEAYPSLSLVFGHAQPRMQDARCYDRFSTELANKEAVVQLATRPLVKSAAILK
ncbi:MAG TPA: hypothetical protein VGF67_19635 [Ktedonobacteraceae bacterium]|jgi:hypothetical protein